MLVQWNNVGDFTSWVRSPDTGSIDATKATYVRVRGKRERWHGAVFYGWPLWPSHSVWLVPGMKVEID